MRIAVCVRLAAFLSLHTPTVVCETLNAAADVDVEDDLNWNSPFPSPVHEDPELDDELEETLDEPDGVGDEEQNKGIHPSGLPLDAVRKYIKELSADEHGPGFGGTPHESRPSVPTKTEMLRLHQVVDRNQDGAVSLEEGLEYVWDHKFMQAFNKSRFEVMDTDMDGYLSRREFNDDLNDTARHHLHLLHGHKKEHSKKVLNEMFLSFDEDGDGVLDREEATPLILWMLTSKKWDLNGDGKISKKEFKKAGETRQLAGANHTERQEARKHGRKIFKKLDNNPRDHVLSPKEFFPYESLIWAGQDAMRHLFAMADANGDNKIHLDELKAETFDYEKLDPHMDSAEHFAGKHAFHYIREWLGKERLIESRQEL